MVLDRLSPTEKVATVAEGVSSPDPFKDVIRTEPAPNLQSLIGDMPYFTRKPTTAILPLSETTSQKNKQEYDDSMNYSSLLDKILEYLPDIKTNDNETITSKPAIQTQSTTHVFTSQQQTADALPAASALQKANSSGNTVGQTINNNQDAHGGFSPHLNSVDSVPGVGLLKLAGCNIYGRMYRVGRIISELSGPCMECKCTEIGVQCRDLSC